MTSLVATNQEVMNEGQENGDVAAFASPQEETQCVPQMKYTAKV
jgi:hypothetical protein